MKYKKRFIKIFLLTTIFYALSWIIYWITFDPYIPFKKEHFIFNPNLFVVYILFALTINQFALVPFIKKQTISIKIFMQSIYITLMLVLFLPYFYFVKYTFASDPHSQFVHNFIQNKNIKPHISKLFTEKKDPFLARECHLIPGTYECASCTQHELHKRISQNPKHYYEEIILVSTTQKISKRNKEFIHKTLYDLTQKENTTFILKKLVHPNPHIQNYSLILWNQLILKKLRPNTHNNPTQQPFNQTNLKRLREKFIEVEPKVREEL